MDKTLKRNLLKKGGKKALAEYNRMNRGPIAQMNTGTRVHTDQRKKIRNIKTGYLRKCKKKEKKYEMQMLRKQ